MSIQVQLPTHLNTLGTETACEVMGVGVITGTECRARISRWVGSSPYPPGSPLEMYHEDMISNQPEGEGGTLEGNSGRVIGENCKQPILPPREQSLIVL